MRIDIDEIPTWLILVILILLAFVPYISILFWCSMLILCVHTLILRAIGRDNNSKISTELFSDGCLNIFLLILIFPLMIFISVGITFGFKSSSDEKKPAKVKIITKEVTNLHVIDSATATVFKYYFLKAKPKQNAKELDQKIMNKDTVTILNKFRTERDTVWYMVEKKQANKTIKGWIYNVEHKIEELPEIEE